MLHERGYALATQTTTTLKAPRRDTYHRLSLAGWSACQRLDGEHTLQDLTSKYLAKYEVPTSHAVVEAVVGLVEAGFAVGTKTSLEVRAENIERLILWRQVRAAIRLVLGSKRRYAGGRISFRPLREQLCGAAPHRGATERSGGGAVAGGQDEKLHQGSPFMSGHARSCGLGAAEQPRRVGHHLRRSDSRGSA
jgi:hypothetical protein